MTTTEATTEWIAVTDWETITKGTRVKATRANGDELSFIADYAGSDNVGNGECSITLDRPEGWTLTIEKPKPQAPTKYGVYLPYFYADGNSTPNIWLLDRTGWIELPNARGCSTKEISAERVAENVGTLVYLGTGSIEQQVNR